MLRKIIEIDGDLCNGCGLCAEACHEGAIGMINGKAKLMRDDYCDGLGDCLPVCPAGAIAFVTKDTSAYDEAAVKANMAAAGKTHKGRPAETGAASRAAAPEALACGCPGTNMKVIARGGPLNAANESRAGHTQAPASRLGQWPVQIKLVPVNAPYFKGAGLLIAADCTAFAYGAFHERFIKNRITIIGCPKLDAGSYADKLTEILKNNDIKSVTVARMEVPCCGGLADAAVTALKNSGRMIPWQVVTIGTDGEIIDG